MPKAAMSRPIRVLVRMRARPSIALPFWLSRGEIRNDAREQMGRVGPGSVRMSRMATDRDTSYAVEWLLGSDEPAIRALTRRDVLGEASGEDGESILDGPRVTALLSGQQDDGGFGGDPYRKWTGAHWRLISLVELSAPPSDPRVAAMAERVLTWISRGLKQSAVVVEDGPTRSHGSVQGNALGACCRAGLADDPRSERLAEALISWQWPDGGWNCDLQATGRRSSFHETLGAAWGLHEYAAATERAQIRRASGRGGGW